MGKQLKKTWIFEWISLIRGYQCITMNYYECSSFFERDYSFIEMVRKDGSVFYSSRTYMDMTKKYNLSEYFFKILFLEVLDSDFIGKDGSFYRERFNERDWEIMRHFKWSNSYDYKLNEFDPETLSYTINFEGISESNPGPSYWEFLKSLNVKAWDEPMQYIVDLKINNKRAYLEARESKEVICEFENPDHIFLFAKRSADNIDYNYCIINDYYNKF